LQPSSLSIAERHIKLAFDDLGFIRNIGGPKVRNSTSRKEKEWMAEVSARALEDEGFTMAWYAVGIALDARVGGSVTSQNSL
jgi:hypothetical protein